MKHGLRFSASLLAAIIAVAVVPHAQQDITARARAIHDRVIALDTHNDIDPQTFTPACNYTMRLTTQVNLPKMVEGQLIADVIASLGSMDFVLGDTDR